MLIEEEVSKRMVYEVYVLGIQEPRRGQRMLDVDCGCTESFRLNMTLGPFPNEY